MSKLLPSQYAKILYGLTNNIGKDSIDKVVQEFFLFLKKERVLSKVNYIIKEFVKYSKKQDGINEIEIISAQKMTEQKIQEIANLFGKKNEIKTEINPDLVGGIIVKSNNIILDASVKTQLNKLKQHLS